MHNTGVIAARAPSVLPVHVGAGPAIYMESNVSNVFELSYPAGVQVDDLLVVVGGVWQAEDSSIAISSGWTLVTTGTNGSYRGHVWVRRHVATGYGRTVSFSGEFDRFFWATVHVFRGVSTALALTSVLEGAGMGGSLTGVTTSGTNRLAFHLTIHTGAATDPPAGWTEVQDAMDSSEALRHAAETTAAPTAGTYTPAARSGLGSIVFRTRFGVRKT